MGKVILESIYKSFYLIGLDLPNLTQDNAGKYDDGSFRFTADLQATSMF